MENPPIYVSVTEVSTSDQVKQRQEEEKRRTLAWTLNNPVEAAAKEDKDAGAELSRAQSDIVKAQERVNKAVQAIPLRKSELDDSNKRVENAKKFVQETSKYAHDQSHPGHRVFQQAGYQLGLAQEDVKKRQTAYDASVKEKSDAEKALGIAVESRKQKEQKKKLPSKNWLTKRKSRVRVQKIMAMIIILFQKLMKLRG